MQIATENRLKELREAKGLEQYDLAALVRKSSSMISRYEKGESEMPVPIVRFFAEYFDVSVEHLMGWDREETTAA